MTRAASNATAPSAKGAIVVGTSSTAAASVAVGTDGQALVADSTQTAGVKWAAPASTGSWIWRGSTSAVSGESIWSMAYNGTNLYIGLTQSGYIMKSTDGLTWTVGNSSASVTGGNAGHKIIYANSLWVVVGGNGSIVTSTDGNTWTSRTSNMGANVIYDVTYGNGKFVAVGAGGGSTNTGGVTYSTDGTTWTRVSMTPAVGTSYWAVVWNGTYFIIGAVSNTTNNGLSSTDGVTWTARAWMGSGSADCLGVWYDGTRTLMWLSNSVLYGSTSSLPTSASVTVYSGTKIGSLTANQTTFYVMKAVTYYSGRLYLCNGSYMKDFSTTPNANDDVQNLSPMTMHPALEPTNGSPYFEAANKDFRVWPFAAGKIATGAYGDIYTSF